MGICSKLFKCSGYSAFIIVILAIAAQLYIQFKDQREFNNMTTADIAASNVDLTDKVIIVTGSNTGIGKPTARVLLSHGAKVILACRNPKKANKAKIDIIDQLIEEGNFKNLSEKELSSNIDTITLDLSSLKSVKQFADSFLNKYDKLNYLILNAGVALFEYQETDDGFEKTFAVNHLGHYYLAKLLTPIMTKTAAKDDIGRVIAVSSLGHQFAPQPFDPWVTNLDLINNASLFSAPLQTYGVSKAMNVLFAKEYNDRYSSKNVYAASLHPGSIKTELARNFKGIWGLVWNGLMPVMEQYFKSLDQGAATTVRTIAVSDKEFIENGGAYWDDCNPAEERLRDDLKEKRLREMLWKLSEDLVNQKM